MLPTHPIHAIVVLHVIAMGRSDTLSKESDTDRSLAAMLNPRI